MPRYSTGLSVSGFKKLRADIRKYRNSLQEKCEEFAYKLAEEGVAVAQMKIGTKDALEFRWESICIAMRLVTDRHRANLSIF